MKIIKTAIISSLFLITSASSIFASNSTAKPTTAKPRYPFSITSLQKIMKENEGENFNFNDFVYLLIDVDKDGQPELFIKEKIKNYNTYYAFTISKKGIVELVMSRTSGGYKDFHYTEDGFLHHYEEHTGGLSQCDTYYKLQGSKVVSTASHMVDQEISDGDDDENIDETIEESYYINREGKPVSNSEEEYINNIAKGYENSLYNLEGWKNFNIR